MFSGARVILGMGKHARIALARTLPLESEDANFYETTIGRRKFTVGMLPHPTAPIAEEKKTLEYNLEPQEITRLSAALVERMEERRPSPEGHSSES